MKKMSLFFAPSIRKEMFNEDHRLTVCSVGLLKALQLPGEILNVVFSEETRAKYCSNNELAKTSFGNMWKYMQTCNNEFYTLQEAMELCQRIEFHLGEHPGSTEYIFVKADFFSKGQTKPFFILKVNIDRLTGSIVYGGNEEYSSFC